MPGERALPELLEALRAGDPTEVSVLGPHRDPAEEPHEDARWYRARSPSGEIAVTFVEALDLLGCGAREGAVGGSPATPESVPDDPTPPRAR
jgi:hypothetical protein